VNVSVVIATFGDQDWSDLAWSHAYPSASDEHPYETKMIHLPDGTLAQARNRGANDATGDWLLFLDADDELAPGYLAAMKKMMRYWNFARPGDLRENPMLFVPSVSYVHAPEYDGATGFASEPRIPQEGQWPRLNECVIGTLVPRRLFLDLGGFRELPSLEDYDLFLRCFDAGARLDYVRDAVYRAYVSADGRNADQSPYDSIWADHLARVNG